MDSTPPSFFTNPNCSCYIQSCLFCQPVEIAITVCYECCTMTGSVYPQKYPASMPSALCRQKKEMLMPITSSLSPELGVDSFRNEKKVHTPNLYSCLLSVFSSHVLVLCYSTVIGWLSEIRKEILYCFKMCLLENVCISI